MSLKPEYRFKNGWLLSLSGNLHLLLINILVNFYNTFLLEPDVVENLLKKFMSSFVSASLLEFDSLKEEIVFFSKGEHPGAK